MLVLPSAHPYSEEQQIALDVVADEPFLALANNDEYRRFTTMLCEKQALILIWLLR